MIDIHIVFIVYVTNVHDYHDQSIN